ncbi:serine/threonine protein kinase [Pedobacter polaris]|uniref:Serine/threonine protein kinase n=1 Tax=Pedobacter polaris TaxID=2571273 RepID=A0A4U1CW92_9SPHI|nr:serine/threonine-protein kinase [Pedobacter polaris]TKC10539.1 serine/threonine protein kinase [Pedobacter polaris]
MSKVFTIAEGLENLGAMRTGGQGSVYKGRRIGAIYSAVKLIPTPIYTEDLNDKNYRNFKNEVEKLLKVNEHPSPNVVKMLSSGITESGSFPFIEMEYIDGPDLSELLQPPHNKIFTLKELIKVAEQLASALAHCHKVGVKHGDIKSNNVKYNIHTGNYVLLDFGLAIMSDEQRRSSIRHAGAVEFMAPEQNEGKMLPQSDVYSYGVILYELLGGQVPFPLSGNSDTGRNTVMIGHLESELPDVTELRKANLPTNWSEEQKAKEMQIPDWLLKLIDKCLQKDPAHRFENGMSLLEALVAGSLSSTTIPVNNLFPNAIEEENKALRQQISELENGMQETKKPGILLSPFVFACLIIAIIGLMGLVGYSEYTKKDHVQTVVNNPIDSIVPATDTNEYDAEKAKRQREMIRRAAVQKVIDSTLREEIRNSQKETTDSTEESTPDTTVTPQGF